MAVGSEADPDMVVEVVEAVLMAVEGGAAEVVGKKTVSNLGIPGFSCIQLPRTEFLVFGLRGSAEN